ncbi:MAG: S8 family serine peptidase [Caldilineaceae bacterium]
MSILRALRFPVLLVSLLVFGLIAAISGNYAGSALAQETSGTVRVAIVYSTAASDAASYAALLNANGFAAQTFAVEAPDLPQQPLQNPVYLPMLAGSGAGQAAQAQAVPDFSQFDLIVIAADTGADDQFSPEAGLVEAIQNSGLPVVGLGAGGYAFFGKIGLSVGYPNGAAISTTSVQVTDFGDSQPYYTTPNALASVGDEILQIFDAEQAGIAISLSERLPEGVRVASSAAGQYAIVKEGQRYLLWGFGASPDAMTDTGRALFVNSLQQQAAKLNVSLRGRAFTPGAGIEQALLDALASVDSLHALVQLDHLPTPEEEKALADAGITLLDFLNGTTYSATVNKSVDPQNSTVTTLVRWAGLFQPADKVDPKIIAGVFEDWADAGGDNVKLLVRFFKDVPNQAAEAVLAKFAPSASVAHAEHTWAIELNKAQILNLAAEDAVQWIEEGPAPLRTFNDVTRNELNVDAVQSPTVSAGSIYYNGLDGSGVNVAIFDTGINTPTFSHPDFAGRLLRTFNDTNGHGSHVAGIVGASGAQSVANCPYGGGCTDFQMRGMAPAVGLAPYGGWNAGTMDDAVNNLGVEVSNHSYVMACGMYDNTAQNVDQLVRGQMTSGGNAIPAHTMVWAAANQGTGAQWCTTGTLPGGGADPTTGPRLLLGAVAGQEPDRGRLAQPQFQPCPAPQQQPRPHVGWSPETRCDGDWLPAVHRQRLAGLPL